MGDRGGGRSSWVYRQAGWRGGGGGVKSHGIKGGVERPRGALGKFQSKIPLSAAGNAENKGGGKKPADREAVRQGTRNRPPKGVDDPSP